MEYSLIVVEGIHDLMALYKILKLKGFREMNRQDQIPKDLDYLIPKRYPFKENNLDRIAPCPTFMKTNNKIIVLKNSGGDRKIIGELKFYR